MPRGEIESQHPSWELKREVRRSSADSFLINAETFVIADPSPDMTDVTLVIDDHLRAGDAPFFSQRRSRPRR
jgi:hypothetical protein